MKLKQYIIEMDVKITDYTDAGDVTVKIGKDTYLYYIDAALLPEILKVYKHQKGKAFNLLKQKGKLIAKNHKAV